MELLKLEIMNEVDAMRKYLREGYGGQYTEGGIASLMWVLEQIEKLQEGEY